MGMTDFVDGALAGLSVPVALNEQPATYGETLDAARAAAATNQLLLVPATVGATLVEEGASMIERLFEDDDPDVAVTQLGVWLLDSGGGIAPAVATPTDDGAIVPIALAQGSGDNSVDVGTELGSILKDEAEAIVPSVLKSEVVGIGVAVVKTLASDVGASVALRGAAKVAGPVAAVISFLITMRDFTIAAMDMIDAESAAASSAVDTGYTAVGMLSNATTKLGELESQIIDGSLSPADARELIEGISTSGERTARVGETTVSQLDELDRGEAGAQIGQLVEARRKKLQEKVLEMLALVSERESRPAVSLGSGSEALDSFVSVLAGPSFEESASAALLGAFTDAPVNNESKHSDGIKTVISDGNTDIIRTGQIWYATPGLGAGPGLDDLFPCGPTVLCDYEPLDRGLFTVFTMEVGGDLPAGPTDLLYQYGFVVDINGDSSDNYRASPMYPSDTFDNTDTWYEIEGGPGGLEFSVTDARGFRPIMSGARVVIDGPLMALIAPQNEVGGGPDAPAVRSRNTTFSHSGDYGQVDPFNIDAFPEVGQPLMIPPAIFKIDGGGSGGPPSDFFDPAISERLDMVGVGIGSDLVGFTSVSPVAVDPTVFNDVPECWATQEMLDDASVLGAGRYAYERDGTTIEVRLQVHDSESAAFGASGFRLGGVNTSCRETLIGQVDGITDVRSIPPDSPLPFASSGVMVTEVSTTGGDGEAASGSFYDGDMSMSFSVTTIGDTAPYVEAILDTSAFATVP